MSFFARATPALPPKTKNVRLISLLLAAILVTMVVGQLFTFEKFPDVLSAMWLPGGEKFMPIYAAVIVTFEVFSLPFLLGLNLSVAMRVVSMVLGWLSIGVWLVISIGNIIWQQAANSGLLGATVPLPIGWWTVLFCVALGVLAVWAAWGMWPLRKHSK